MKTVIDVLAERFPRLAKELPAAIGDPMILGMIGKWQPPDEHAFEEMKAGLARVPADKTDLVTDAALAAARHLEAAWKGFSTEIGPAKLAELFTLGMSLAAGVAAPDVTPEANAIGKTLDLLGGPEAPAAVAVFGAWTQEGLRLKPGILSEAQVRAIVSVLKGGEPAALDQLVSGADRIMIAQEVTLRKFGKAVKPLLDLLANRKKKHAETAGAANGAA